MHQWLNTFTLHLIQKLLHQMYVWSFHLYHIVFKIHFQLLLHLLGYQGRYLLLLHRHPYVDSLQEKHLVLQSLHHQWFQLNLQHHLLFYMLKLLNIFLPESIYLEILPACFLILDHSYKDDQILPVFMIHEAPLLHPHSLDSFHVPLAFHAYFIMLSAVANHSQHSHLCLSQGFFS